MGGTSAGLVAAFAGVCLLFIDELGLKDLRLDDLAGAAGQSTALGNALVLLSAAMLGGRLIFTARLVRRMNPARVMMWQMLLALPCFAVARARRAISSNSLSSPMAFAIGRA